MGGTESCWKWRGSNIEREKEIWERWPWCWTDRGLRAGQSSCGVDLGDAFQLPKEDLASAMRVLSAPEASAVRTMCGGAAPDHDDYLARIKMELLASAFCVAGCTE